MNIRIYVDANYLQCLQNTVVVDDDVSIYKVILVVIPSAIYVTYDSTDRNYWSFKQSQDNPTPISRTYIL